VLHKKHAAVIAAVAQAVDFARVSELPYFACAAARKQPASENGAVQKNHIESRAR
jgi:hypothetical protein